MKTAPWLLTLMAATFLAQWAIPASIIWRYETVLATGKVFKFQTHPVDPYDAFRGRYVALGFNWESAPLMANVRSPNPGERMFALIEIGTNGFAQIKGLTFERPQTEDYFGVKVRYCLSPTNVLIQFPFDRYYMNEKLAPAADTAYRQHAGRSGRQDAYVAVRVQNGRATIEDLYVAGKPIRDFLAP